MFDMFEKMKIRKLLGNLNEAFEKERIDALLAEVKEYGEMGISLACEGILSSEIHPAKTSVVLESLFDYKHLKYFFLPLSSTNGSIRQAARAVLESRLAKIPVEELLHALVDASFYTRKNVTDLIHLKKDPKVVKPAIKLYSETQDETLKKNLLSIFEQYPDPQVKDFLLKLIKKCNYWERAYIIRLLKDYQDPEVASVLEEMLELKDVALLKNVVDSLGMMKVHGSARKIVPLLESEDLLLRQKAVEALQQMVNPSVVSELMKLIKSTNVNTRRCVVEVLNSFRDEQSITALIKALEDDDWWVREIATDALTQSENKSIPDMLQKLLHVKNVKVRQCAVSFFAKISAPYVIKDLVLLLDDEEWLIRENAVEALTRINDARVLPYILKKAGDKDIKLSLPECIARFKREPAIQALAKLLKAGDNELLIACLKVITKNQMVELVPVLKEVAHNAQFEVNDQINNTIRSLNGEIKTPTNNPFWRG